MKQLAALAGEARLCEETEALEKRGMGVRSEAAGRIAGA